MSANELTSKVRELKELKAFAEQIADEITAIEDLIKAEMTERNTEEMTVDVFKIRWTRMTSSRFDTAAFKKPCRPLRTVHQTDREPPLLDRIRKAPYKPHRPK